MEVPVTIDFEQAASGTTVSITSPGSRETVEAKVPPGVKDGQRVRLRGRGNAAGGATGDLILVVTVRDHPYFRRDGLNVLLDVPVSLYEAVLGGRVEVPTLAGRVTITVPPGSGGGQKLRIKGQGIRRGEEVGDQLCVLRVAVPKGLADDDRAAVERLRDRYPVDARASVPWK